MTAPRPSSPDLPDDPLWHRDAVMYELHVRAFSDSNADGVGDFAGLIDKLDYLVDLGVTAVWLLPFYPSPLRDGGYDIADYTGIHESYGTRRDFARLMREAHRRGLRIITELVLNHTSVDHPWFQRARLAPKGSKHRDFYVWSDTPARYEDTRIIFKDFESSNWAWDPVAKAYYWHRFYSHQPDLNFDNPAVQDALLEVVDYWMDLGVDGLRLDAVPYLYEREGTNCENLPETHAFLKKLRAHVDAKYKNRILLAEANQWPADAASYFGDGDECHMNFHFPLMPRMFMAVELEDSFPIINILRQTPELPQGCQWATFLRNHDELTLEMVTDEDRDTMWRAYASDPTARINLGIRRRLAPLLKLRRKIELMNALLLSLPGTPVLYYGDEIGMGDNIYLGDRDGVRTPMQWSPDRNAGFSRANPQKLYLPAIIDPEFHFEATNVETQQKNPSSLLWWTKHLIAKRKEHKVFGRGSIEFLATDNARILAFVREHEGEALLVVANLSKYAQCVHVDLSRFHGGVPREVFGQARFPAIGGDPYFLSMAPHAFLWLVLEGGDAPADSSRPLATLRAKAQWHEVLEPARRAELARALARHATEQRWFRGKSRVKKNASIVDVVRSPELGAAYAVVLLSIEYDEGAAETYVVPLGFAEDGEPRAEIPRGAVIARVEIAGGHAGTLYDALIDEPFANGLLGTISARRTLAGERGQLAGVPLRALKDVPKDASLAPRLAGVEQTNSNVFYGGRLVLKLFRAISPGANPEVEIGRYLSQEAFRGATRLAGYLEYRCSGEEESALGTLFEFVSNQGDAWHMTLDALDWYFDRVLADEAQPSPPADESKPLVAAARAPLPGAARALLGPYVDRIRLLGRRTADLHLALSRESKDAAFKPEPFDTMHQQSLYQSAHTMRARTWERLAKGRAALDGPVRELVDTALAREKDVDRMLARITRKRVEVDRIRVHGDYHLGQVLYTGEDFVIIDFEGEPDRSLAQRRFKRCPLRDVAGMLRSFHYASEAALRSGRPRAGDLAHLRRWDRAWTDWVSGEFLAGYLDTAGDARFLPRADEDTQMLLDFYLLEKCIYEIRYELNSRPDWLEIPLRGLTRLIEAGAGEP